MDHVLWVLINKPVKFEAALAVALLMPNSSKHAKSNVQLPLYNYFYILHYIDTPSC